MNFLIINFLFSKSNTALLAIRKSQPNMPATCGKLRFLYNSFICCIEVNTAFKFFILYHEIENESMFPKYNSSITELKPELGLSVSRFSKSTLEKNRII